jgi:peptidoglycan/LPS O-acetylase OafA/YrhL
MLKNKLCPPPIARHASLKKIPELDGVRGAAILLVIILHFGHIVPTSLNLFNILYLSFVMIGWIGVDLFFVLSGFLITRILLNTKHSPHYFKSFYARRALRILPIYFLFIFAIFDCHLPLTSIFHLPLGSGSGSFHPGDWEQLWYWFHVSNWQSAWGVYAYTPIGHLWSLAVEEQFYFVWPLVVLLCSENVLIAVCVSLIFVSVGLRYLPVFQAIQVVHPEFIYRLTPFRVEPLIFGAILAIGEAKRFVYTEVARQCVPLFFMIGCAGIGAAVFVSGSPLYNSRAMSSYGYSAVAFLCSSVVLYGIRNSGSSLAGARILRSPILTQCGKYSYAMYIFQTPLNFMVSSWFVYKSIPYLNGFAASLISILLGISLSYLAARCSWALIEQRFLKLKDSFPAE